MNLYFCYNVNVSSDKNVRVVQKNHRQSSSSDHYHYISFQKSHPSVYVFFSSI